MKIEDLHAYKHAINDVLELLNKHYENVAKEEKYPQHDHYCNGVDDCIGMVEKLRNVVDDCIDIAKELKEGGNNEN